MCLMAAKLENKYEIRNKIMWFFFLIYLECA